MASDNPFASLNVSAVINAAGKMTALGGSAQQSKVADAQRAAAGAHVELKRLRRAAGERVAELTGAEGGSITTGAAAGICIGVAAILSGTDAEKICQLPELKKGPREILLQHGHDINFGAPVSQMVRLGGGTPIVVGHKNAVVAEDFRAAICGETAGLLFVQSHHCMQENRLELDAMVTLAHEARLPLLVDAAAEEDLRRYVSSGADLVTYSGGKAIAGPTVGFIVGRRTLIDACELQCRGIARTMKVGKEQIMGLMAALEDYPRPVDSESILRRLVNELGGLSGIAIEVVDDRAGRDIQRLGIRSASRGVDMVDMVRFLETGKPNIYTRNHQLGDGLVLIDPRELHQEQVSIIVDRIRNFLEDQCELP